MVFKRPMNKVFAGFCQSQPKEVLSRCSFDTHHCCYASSLSGLDCGIVSQMMPSLTPRNPHFRTFTPVFLVFLAKNVRGLADGDVCSYASNLICYTFFVFVLYLLSLTVAIFV